MCVEAPARDWHSHDDAEIMVILIRQNGSIVSLDALYLRWS